jgi:tetratricopeptide (TPR) repeat protein
MVPQEPLWKKILYSTVTPFLLLVVPAHAAGLTQKARLAVFPFIDAESHMLRMNISSIFQRELLKYDFVEIVPLEREGDDIYEIEPSHLWTGVERGRKQGGIIWNIRHQVIEEIRAAKNAEYAVSGSVLRSGGQLKMEVRVTKTERILSKEQVPAFSTGAAEPTYKELSEKVPDLASAIADWLKKEHMQGKAEEEMRQYLGRIISYADTVNALEGYVREQPRSIPLRALLLDLYLKEKTKYQQKILEEGLTIVELFKTAEMSDTRYLLSLSIDPFDIAAEAYEENGDWENAISMRERALVLFSFRKRKHRDGLARDLYILGQAYEKKGHTARAFEHYNRAREYVSASSEYHTKIHDGIKRTEKK